MAVGVSELVLEVDDLDAAERFYTKLIGLDVLARPDSKRVWLAVGDRTRLGLWRPQVGIAGGRGGSHVHFAIAISEAEYDRAVERLRGNGVEIHEESPDGGRALYVTDTDGNVVELNTKHATGIAGG